MTFPPPHQPPWPPNNQPGNPQQPWQPGPYPFAQGPILPPYSGLAIAALVTGFLCGPLGVILGILGIHDTRNGGKRGRGMAIAGIVLGSLSLLASLVLIGRAVTGANSVQATELEVGDCIEGLPADDGKEVVRITTISCAKPHRSELFANIEITASNYPSSSDFDMYAKKCSERLRSDHPSTASTSGIGIFTLHPTKDSWDQGDRTISCFVVTDEARAGSILK